MSTRTNIERITENNGIINDNNVDLVALKNRIDNLPDTSTATATASDILEGKTAFVNGVKVNGVMVNNGSLNYNPSTSSQTIPAGYTSGGTVTAMELEEITVTATGSQQIITPTQNKDGISKVTVNPIDTDWTELGYSGVPTIVDDGFDYAKQIKENWNSSITNMNQKYQNNINLRYFPMVDTSNVTNFTRCFDSSRLNFLPALNMSAGIYFYRLCMGCTTLEYVLNINTENGQNFQEAFQGCSRLTQFPVINTSKAWNVHSMFNRCSSLVTAPAIDTSNVTDAAYFYFGCTKLENVPIYNFKKCTANSTEFYVMFQDCPALTNESLNNIMASLLTATEYAGTKTLKYIGLKQTQTEICKTLSNWTALSQAGWTTRLR